jgi:quinoprotein glucose dehydrogenase
MFKGLCAAAAAMLLVTGFAAQAQERRTTWSGLYTAEQADRGAKVYEAECSACHGATLSGIEQAPALAGDQFSANWEGQSLADLFDRMRTTMPQTNPGGLSRAQNADILAYILRTNGFPAGAAPLDGAAGALANATFVTYKP